MPLTGSTPLRKTVLARVLPLSIAAMLVIMGISRLEIRRAIRAEVTRRLDQTVVFRAAELGKRFDWLRQSAEVIADNDLIVQSIMDKPQPGEPLAVFFGSLRMPSPSFQRATLTDRQGRTLASSDHEGVADTSGFLDKTIGGSNHFEIGKDRIIVATPVLSDGSPEGMIVVEYDTQAYINQFQAGHPGQRLRIRTGERLIGESTSDTPTDTWTTPSAGIPGYAPLTLEWAESRDLAFAPIASMDLFFAFVLVGFLIALVLGIFAAARMATRPLTQFVDQLDQIESTNDLSRRLSLMGTREFDRLALAFNSMMDSLSTKTVSITAIRRSESDLRTVIEGVPHGILGTSRDGLITLVNAELESMLGFSREELIGRPATNWIPELSSPLCSESTTTPPTNQERQQAVGIDRTGNPVPIELGFNTVELAGETHVLASVVDVSARIERENEKKRSHAETQGILDAIPAVVLFKDTQNRLLRVNHAAAKMMGAEPEEIEGRHCRDFFVDHEKRHEDDLSVIRSGKPKSGVIESVDTAEETRWTSTDKIPVLDESGQPTGIITVINDITELTRAEALASQQRLIIQENETRIGLAIAGANVGYWDWDVGSSEVRVSEELSAQIGEKVAYRTFDEWKARLHPDDVPSAEAALARCFDGTTKDYETIFRMRHRDGSYRWIHSGGRLSVDASGTPTRMTGVHIDITDRKQSEEALVRVNRELQRSNGELAQFAYIASHDLQEPLRKVTSFCVLLEEDCKDSLSEEALHFLGYIVDGASRMKSLIQDLLTFSRIDHQGVALSEVELSEVLEHVRENLSEAIIESNAVITSDPLPMVHADARQLAQLLQNLIGNAVKYRSDLPPKIHVSARSEPGEWILTVRDNGIGIERRFHEQIFGVFKRLHTMDEYQGTGIGLAICQRIANSLGGRIWIESELNQGSTFYVAIPRTDTDP